MTTSADRTWRDALAGTSAAIGNELHARWLCEVASGADNSTEFVSLLGERPNERMSRHLDEMIERYRQGEPVQYVLGRWGFRRLDLAVDRRVLIPRPETEEVAEVAIDLARRAGPPRLIADLGTGSGAIGLALADELPLDGTTVWLTDIDTDALDVARANAAGLGRAASNVRISAGSWYEALPQGARFDMIVSNPPYVADGETVEPIVRAWEPSVALFAGHDGLREVELLVANAADHLVPGGWLVLEIGATQGRAVAALMTFAGFDPVEIRADAAGRDRVAVARLSS